MVDCYGVGRFTGSFPNNTIKYTFMLFNHCINSWCNGLSEGKMKFQGLCING